MSRHRTTFLLAVMASCLLTAAAAGGSPSTQSWTQWGGPSQSFVAPAEGLASAWPATGPAQLWARDLGDGYSTILVEDGRLYTQYRVDEEREAVVCLSAADGSTIWERRYEHRPRADHVRQFGSGPRATPLLAGDSLYTIGVAGRMLALRKADGEIRWQRDLWDEPELAGTVLQHGYASSPIEYGDTVIALVGGEKVGVVAFSKKDGHTVWASPPMANGYGTPRLFDVQGQDQLVTYMGEEVVGLDPHDGRVLWRHSQADVQGEGISPPVLVDGRFLFVSSPGAGSFGLELVRDQDTTRVEPRWSSRKVQLFHVTTSVQGDWVYGSSGTRSPAFLAAVNVKTGDIPWRERGFGKANLVTAGGRVVILDEDGVLALATAKPEGLTVHSRAELLGEPAWTAPTIVGSRLYVRDTQRIVALDLGVGGAAAPPPIPTPEPALVDVSGDGEPLPPLPADASEAIRLLYRVDAAARAVRSARFRSRVVPTGSARAFTPTSEGEGVLVGWDGRGPARFYARVRATDEQGSSRDLTGGGDGRSFFLVDHSTRTAYHDIDRGVLGSAQGTLLGLGMLELVHPTPFTDEVRAQQVELQGTEEVDGEPCHRVFVRYAGTDGSSTWFFSTKDLLPRKRIRHVTDREGREGTIETTLSDLQIAPDVDDALFRLQLPEGYREVDDFAP